MNGKLLIAFFSRTSVALLNFLIVLLTARYMGVEARGQIAMIMLGITFSQVLQQVIGGAIIYFAKKTPLKNLIIPSYLWAIAAAFLVTVTLVSFKQIPINYSFDVFVLSIIQSLIATHLTLLLSFEKIKKQNVVMLLQSTLIVGCLAINTLVLNNNHVADYINALYIAYTFCFIVSAYFLLNCDVIHSNEYQLNSILIKSILKYGLVIQSTNIVQLLNYRLSYLLLNTFSGSAALGVFSTAVSLGESAWLFSKSLTNIQFPKIIHSTDSQYKIELTINYAKASLIGTAILLLPLLFIPATLYTSIFGVEFESLKTTIYLLAPGLITIGFSTLISHYFSGIQKNNINLFASSLGLIITLIAGYLLVPGLGLNGACIATTVSYLLTGIFLISVFLKITNQKLAQLVPTKISFKEILALLK
jgi:O-antigen/teichoic acid export membrane protein